MGVLIFELLLLISIFVNLVEQAKTRSELDVYERLLKEDRMTGIKNTKFIPADPVTFSICCKYISYTLRRRNDQFIPCIMSIKIVRMF